MDAVRLTARCPTCQVKMEREVTTHLPKGFSCGRCATGLIRYGESPKNILELKGCVICNHSFFYVEKDFPRGVAFTIIGIGIVLSFFTYGISLVICGAIDWILYKILPTFRVCYLCQTEYRGLPEDPTLENYDPHKGVAYDARRVLPHFDPEKL